MIKKGDFVELEYTACIDNNGVIFDTTSEETAKVHNIYNKEASYKPLIVCVGEGHLLKGLDDFVVDKTPGKYIVKLENAFGKKNAKLLRLISVGEFKKHDVQPVPGLEVDLDGHRGIIRTVNGGRVIVDFNHPLASQDITYDINILGKVDDEKKKIIGIMNLFKIPFSEVDVAENKAMIKIGIELPDNIKELLGNEIKRLTNVKEVEFTK